jgi:hypothetical protein
MTPVGIDVGFDALVQAGVIVASCERVGRAAVGLRPAPTGWQVAAWAPAGVSFPEGIVGTAAELAGGSLLLGSCNHASAAALRRHIQWLRPRPMGQEASIGLGDRLGLAGPGHIRALRAHVGIAPILAQQSARELARTRRSFDDVLTAATFAVMAEGWRTGYGADADHLKTVAQLDAAVAAGFTTVTADPIELVPDLPGDAPAKAIAAAYQHVPWAAIEDDEKAFAVRYPAVLETDGSSIPLPPEALRAAAARFAPAVAHLVTMYRRFETVAGSRGSEFEVAVDEISHPTTAVDHVYLATELSRLGVRWQKFAPRFVGRFEKGTDYLGDPAALEVDVALHAAIARRLGPYRLSVHSGSDKFSAYEGIVRATRGLVHLKTSGTSYLEALRTISMVDPTLLRRIWSVSESSYATARSSYHVSASLANVPDVSSIADQDLPGLFDLRDVREILHVTYGAVLVSAPSTDAAGPDREGLGDALRRCIWVNRGRYWSEIAAHIGRHLAPLDPSTHD